jgi:NitT/TauT family transport system substrate-binding protein
MIHSRRRIAAAASASLAAALVLSACSGTTDDGGDGDGEELTPVTLQLQWLPQGQFAGYFAAAEQGYFEEAGLDVEIIPSGGDIVPQDALANGDVDYAIAWVPKVLGSIEAGANVTNVAQIFQKSGTLQVAWADSDIESVADFEGKKIGSWGFGNEWEIFAAMAEEGLDSSTVEIITQDFNMNAFLSGDIDAAQAMTYNEYAQLLESIDPETGELYTEDDFTVISYEDTVGAMLQDAIWADTERLESDEEYQETTVEFLKAVIKGWVYAAREPRGSVADHDRRRLRLGSEPRAVDGQRDQQAHLAGGERHRVHRRGGVRRDGRGSTQRRERDRREPHHGGAAGIRLDERVHRAGACRARGRGHRCHR